MDKKSGKWKGSSEDTRLLLRRVGLPMEVSPTDSGGSPLKFSQKLAYGVGHVLNDNFAAVWFSYTLLYFQVVMGMPKSMTGSLLLIGQVVDAVATPIVGIYADRTGRRIIWHLAGTIMTVVTFPLIFMGWPTYQGSELSSEEEEPFFGGAWIIGGYYSALIVVFQIGWAVVQISHLALIPIMTPLQSERAELTAIRFSVSIGSSIFMYLVTWFILHVTQEKKRDVSQGKKSALGPADAYKFRNIVLIGLAIGGVFAAWFHIFLRVPGDKAKIDSTKTREESEAVKSGIRGYLTSIRLYQVSLLYVSSRLFLTLSLVYMPLYLVENVGDRTELLGTVPLVSYLASFISSVIVKQLNPYIGSKCVYLIGGVISILGCIWIGIGQGRLNLTGELFSIAVLLGAGSSITMVSSLCLTADFIGTQTEHGAFIYSVVTFADKLLNGIAVMIIEESKCKDCSHYYQDVLAYACGATVLIGILDLVSLQFRSLGFGKLEETIKNLRISRN